MDTGPHFLAKLVRILQNQIDGRRSRRRPTQLFLETIAHTWREFHIAKADVKRRFAVETVSAEAILRIAARHGHLRTCVKLGLLPNDAEKFTVNEGAAFRTRYKTTDEVSEGKLRVVSGGTIETKRRRH